MTNIQCPQCGHLALSVATRCPRCGHEFASDLLHPLPPMPRRPWLRPALNAAAAVVVVAGLALLARGNARVRSSAPSAESAPPAPIATPAADTTPPAPVAGPPVAAAPVPAAPVPAARTPAAAPRTAPLPAAEPPVASDLLRRYATEWVNVRARRSMGGAPVLVLRPGDSVSVDSLVRGWYRVVKNGRGVGYAHRRFLAASPGAAGAP